MVVDRFPSPDRGWHPKNLPYETSDVVNDTLKEKFSYYYPPIFEDFHRGLEWVMFVARTIAANSPTVAMYRLPRSPIDYIVSNDFVRIYKKHFGREAKRSRDAPSNSDKNEADGPFVRFAVESLRELGIRHDKQEPYKAETIARAISDIKDGRVRRKNVTKHSRAKRT